MTPKEIKRIAREYAEECIAPCGFSDDTFKELVDEKAEMAAYILHWLCKRYCLVEKSKATDLCRLTLDHGDSVDYGLIDSLTDIVCDIFSEQYQQVAENKSTNPEIAKEVEE